jgi:hypothetical protein
MHLGPIVIFCGALLVTGGIMTDHASGESISVGGIALESAYAGFIRGKVTDNEKENPGYGYTVAYHGHEGDATIYVYSKSQREIPNGPASKVVMEEFNQATQEIIALGQMTGSKIELVDRYGTGSPERGGEFLCAEFVLSDGAGSRRTFLYVTGAANRFVKIRVTLRTNDARDPAARNFADAVARGLWRKSAGRYEVLGLVSIAVFAPWSWHTEDLDEATIRGTIFRCYEEGNHQELAYLLVGDISADPDEPDIARLTPERVAEVDKFLEAGIRALMASDGRRMIRWMSSRLNETPSLKGLVTAYIAEDQGRDRQYVDLRIPVRGRKVVVAGCFDVKRAAEFAAPIFASLQNATILSDT